ncbi:hypothetical protein CBL_20351 [Carabus blaptoides fortunei]
MVHKVRDLILDDLRTAGYFSLSVDSTPDGSHIDQLTVIVRYVSPDDGLPIERFLTFLEMGSHTGESMAKMGDEEAQNTGTRLGLKNYNTGLNSEAFKMTFVGEISITSKWQRMVERTQKKNESISEYYHDKVKYYQDLLLCITEIKEQVFIGLWSRELCNMVAGKQHDDQDALLHDLLQFDELNRVRKERFKTQRPDEKSNMQKPHVKLNNATVASSMIDTGTTVCPIRKSVAQRADFSPYLLEKPIVLTGFGVNNVHQKFGYCRDAPFKEIDLEANTFKAKLNDVNAEVLVPVMNVGNKNIEVCEGDKYLAKTWRC